MKRLVLLILILCAIIIVGDLVNKIGADDKMTVEGYILNKEGVLYLITDEEFDVKTAKEQSNQEFIRSYGGIYRLDSVPFSFSPYKDGQKMKVWFSEVLESHPAKIKVLKAKRK
ncbi:DUF3221 domain-containing protein [Bacillus sp. HNG]|uniref:DUF3221 domain-containing protein n=1 Tax=Bacillus sp. HNG TaxID=2293325 RepID=UPI000E2F8ECD|nr:DUF3221 domain-containing protein [Bacillus sp. HNG]RFB09441.1 DUF3221 domain-containing protein [Bacillus sp. HNG]